MGPYNCSYERIGSTLYLMCTACNRVRETDIPPEKVRDLCPVLLKGAPDRSAGALSVSALLTAPHNYVQTAGNLLGFDRRAIAILGLAIDGLDEKQRVSLNNDCLVSEVGEYELIISYDKIRQLIWASLRSGAGDNFRSIRWSRDGVAERDIDDAVAGGAPIVLLYESNENFDRDISNSMIIIPAV